MDIVAELSKKFRLNRQYAGNMIALIDDRNTIPFIARHRKEMTGSCGDQVLREPSDRLQYLRNLERRKEEILESIVAQGKMTDTLSLSVQSAKALAEAEDLYRPYRPKRRTRATIAQEKGLRPLADLIMAQTQRGTTLEKLTAPYINAEKGVEPREGAVQGAQDALAEEISDDAEIRKKLHQIIRRDGLVVSRAVQENPVYGMYAKYSEPVSKIPSHQILAIDRGEKEECLKVKLELNDAPAFTALCDWFVKSDSVTSARAKEAMGDSWKRLILPSLERETRNELTQWAARQAISMLALNLKPLLLQPPVKDKVIMGFDPVYRTGCKIAAVDVTGRVLGTTVVYPTSLHKKTEEAKKELKRLIQKHGVTVISIRNGITPKESEIFMAELLCELEALVSYMVVSETGTSVYSASKLAAAELPEFDVSLRSAVSIARRLQDPLTELVKIDPKAIGIGQYQHDMPPAELDSTLGGVAENCTSSVDVDLNTMSVSLSTHISGLNETVVKNVIAYWDDNGLFQNRSQLKKVARFGPKAYEQCAGFLRIPRGRNILDNTFVHPESHDTVTKLLELLGTKPSDLTMQGVGMVSQQIKEIGWKKAAEACGVGIPMLTDIIAELQKPGRDIRDEFPPPLLRADTMSLSGLKVGMELTDTARNVTNFGTFIDIGVHQDGLVYTSQISGRFIKHPSDLVKVGDVVTVTVFSVGEAERCISLTMKRTEAQRAKA